MIIVYNGRFDSATNEELRQQLKAFADGHDSDARSCRLLDESIASNTVAAHYVEEKKRESLWMHQQLDNK